MTISFRLELGGTIGLGLKDVLSRSAATATSTPSSISPRRRFLPSSNRHRPQRDPARPVPKMEHHPVGGQPPAEFVRFDSADGFRQDDDKLVVAGLQIRGSAIVGRRQ
ncbi:MAG: hypothetical protein ACLUI3_00730 [Christensenellales bacterium]